MACPCRTLPYQRSYGVVMGTMKVPLPDSLESFVNEQVRSRGYGTSSEYVRELIRKDRDRQRLRSLLVEGASFPPGSIAERAYFDALRANVCAYSAGCSARDRKRLTG